MNRPFLMKTRVWLKRIARSKTLMFNALMAGLIALEASFSLLQPLVAGNVFAYSSIVLTVGNAILRTITTKPLKEL